MKEARETEQAVLPVLHQPTRSIFLGLTSLRVGIRNPLEPCNGLKILWNKNFQSLIVI
jgi:hypothetical protein